MKNNKAQWKSKKAFSCFITKITRNYSFASKKRLWLFILPRILFWGSLMVYMLLAILKERVGLLFRKKCTSGPRKKIKGKFWMRIGSELEEERMNTSRLRILIFMVLDWKKTIFEKLKCLQSYIKLFFKSKNFFIILL